MGLPGGAGAQAHRGLLAKAEKLHLPGLHILAAGRLAAHLDLVIALAIAADARRQQQPLVGAVVNAHQKDVAHPSVGVDAGANDTPLPILGESARRAAGGQIGLEAAAVVEELGKAGANGIDGDDGVTMEGLVAGAVEPIGGNSYPLVQVLQARSLAGDRIP